jgi:RimJ/RimL family protein N-acetyltransferase
VRAVATPRLVLEPQTAAHAAVMHALLADPALYRHENEPPPSVAWLRERFERLESRRSPDGREEWLNWVMRLRETDALTGYVQATVHGDGSAAVAYVLGSAWWGRGLATEAVQAMIGELAAAHGVHTLRAVLKRSNEPSLRLLQRLGFAPAPQEEHERCGVEPDERLLWRPVADAAAADHR